MRERAKISFYWPGMHSDIERAALTCTPCQTHLPSQQKESFAVREPATRAFEAVHVDFFHFGGKQFLVYIDEFSGWPSVQMMGTTATSLQLIRALRAYAPSVKPHTISVDPRLKCYV